MNAKLLLVTGLAACMPSTPTADLGDLPTPRIVGSSGGFYLDYDRSDDQCFTLSDQVSGSVDGRPLILSDAGGWRSTTHGDVCDRIAFRFPSALDAQPLTTIELADDITAWTFTVEGLAPGHWTLTSPQSVTEGGDLTVSYAPATAGVALEFVYVNNAAVGRVTNQTADSVTVHIDAGHWSDSQPTLRGTSLPGTLGVKLSPLPVHDCPATQCSFSTNMPDPARPITVVIP